MHRKGEGLGNQFLASIRETDLILHVVRCFEDENIVHVAGQIEPLSDIETINLELVLADLQMCDNILTKLERQARTDKTQQPKYELLVKIKKQLNQNQPVSDLDLSPEEVTLLNEYHFLTNKPVIYICNMSETSITQTNPLYEKVKDYAQKQGNHSLPLCAQLEEELLQLDEGEVQEYLHSFNLKESGLNQMVRKSYESLKLITFITTGKQETRAWTIKQGTKAPQAAGAIHSDLENGLYSVLR